MRFLILLIFVLATPGYSLATLYSFVDKQGVRHYTNVPTDSRARKVQANTRWATSGPMIRKLSVRDSFPSSGKRGSVAAFDLEDHIRRASFQYQVDPLLI